MQKEKGGKEYIVEHVSTGPRFRKNRKTGEGVEKKSEGGTIRGLKRGGEKEVHIP